MTDEEFDIIDELYFVTAYADLKAELDISDNSLSENLSEMIKKGWVKLYSQVDREMDFDLKDFQTNYKSYFYLASKKGLLKHNS